MNPSPVNTSRLERRSLSYGLFLFAGYLYYRLYYRRFKVIGRKTIPKGVPVIFAANHQNALMDDIALLFGTRKQVVIMSRASLFNNSILARIFNWFKMIPVYRPRDGMENMDRNETSFIRAASVLSKRRYITIFPEGNHDDRKRLRPLKKGICRISFLAEENAGFNSGLVIMPVGLNFSDVYRAGSDLLVIFGRPIQVDEYKNLYHENQVKAINQLRDDLASRLKEVMIHIGTEKYYDVVYQATKMFYRAILKSRNLKENLLTRYECQRELATKISLAAEADETIGERLKNLIIPYHSLLKRYKIRDRVVEQYRLPVTSVLMKLLAALVFIPFHLYGMILNYIPYKVPVLISKNVRDVVFHSSLHFGISLFLFPVYYAILMLILWLSGVTGFVAIIILISLPVTGLIAFYNYLHIRRLLGELRFLVIKYRNSSAWNHIIRQREAIAEFIESITNLNLKNT